MIKQPINIPINDTGEAMYRLEEEYTIRFNDDLVITIPEGIEYDGASVPRWAWSIGGIRPDGLIRAGALVHDMFYRYYGKLPEEWSNIVRKITRKEADKIFLVMNIMSGMHPIRAYIAWASVRIGGGKKWDAKVKAEKEAAKKNNGK